MTADLLAARRCARMRVPMKIRAATTQSTRKLKPDTGWVWTLPNRPEAGG